MATTKIWAIKSRLDKVINYATNPSKTENQDFQDFIYNDLNAVVEYTMDSNKTEKQFYVTGINCLQGIALQQMNAVKQQYQKTSGILGFHGYQSFAPNEVTPQQAHEIGVKLANKLWGDRFQVIVTTHLDTSYEGKPRLHNHFVLNSVSFKDGLRFYDNKKTYALMRRTSDQLCKEFALSTIEHPKKGKHYAEWEAEKENHPTGRSLVRKDIDIAIEASLTFTQFINVLKKQGYEVKSGVKHIAVRPPNKERFIRLRSLGEEYNEEALRDKLLSKSTITHSKKIELNQSLHLHGRMNPQNTKKITGIKALYFSYLYKMEILPKPNASNKRVHFLLRDDIRQLDKINNEMKFLANYHLENQNQLIIHKENAQQRISYLCQKRKGLYNKKRRCKENEVDGYKEQIANLSKEVSMLRKEVISCDGILSRSLRMINNLNLIKQEKNMKGKGVRNNEQCRRGRSNRESNSKHEF